MSASTKEAKRDCCGGKCLMRCYQTKKVFAQVNAQVRKDLALLWVVLGVKL